MVKTCIRCKNTKDITLFHNSKRQKDGKAYYCIDCTKILKHQEYEKNKDRYISYLKDYRATPHGKKIIRSIYVRMRDKYPDKYRARVLLNAAVGRKEIVKPDQCEICLCVKRLCGHHDDYNKPLEVRWLCYSCHTKWHKENGIF